MQNNCQLVPINLSHSTSVNSAEEHRRVFQLKDCELNIFETYHRCENVVLSHDGLVVSSMMRGKKVMSPFGAADFDFLPGESIIIPQGISMKVDFPEADEQHPVQCATLSLNWDMVQKNLNFLNETYPNLEAPFEWKLNFQQYHFSNNRELASSISKLISISMEDNMAKDALSDLSLKFLLLRIIQTQNLACLKSPTMPDNRFLPAVNYIKKHLSEKISIDSLAKAACMSKSVFFQSFKNQFGLPPLEYILQQRLDRAKAMMADAALSITDICYQCGFNNLNYFIKLFKREEGLTPTAYRKNNHPIV